MLRLEEGQALLVGEDEGGKGGILATIKNAQRDHEDGKGGKTARGKQEWLAKSRTITAKEERETTIEKSIITPGGRGTR